MEVLAEPAFILAALCIVAFAAGFIDAAVGGGGLVQIPAMFILLPEQPPATILGTNKFCAVWGTGSAAVQYLRHVGVQWRVALPAAAAALAMGFAGARAMAAIPAEIFRPLVLVLLIGVLTITWTRKEFGRSHAPRLHGSVQTWAALGVGAAIGFYDGAFGPGTGAFLIFAFVGLFGFGFLMASAAAKFVNLITNLAALAYFVPAGHVRYELAIPMAVCNVGGNLLGSRLAIRKGSGYVRALFLLVVGLLILRYAWDLYRH